MPARHGIALQPPRLSGSNPKRTHGSGSTVRCGPTSPLPQPPKEPMSHDRDRPHPLRSLAVLAVGALGFALAQTTLIPTLTSLREELGTDTNGVAWVLTGYLLAAAV